MNHSATAPALVITGGHDFFPFAAKHIALAISGARLVTLKDCGHFPYLECPAPLRDQIDAFFRWKVVVPITADSGVIADAILSG